jgi:hypothetical protein
MKRWEYVELSVKILTEQTDVGIAVADTYVGYD